MFFAKIKVIACLATFRKKDYSVAVNFSANKIEQLRNQFEVSGEEGPATE